eukprot:Hpha_TRINITY_DN2028_c0_g1::TRINITY_DN2028_c0_g1_i1::g.82871::m.82871
MTEVHDNGLALVPVPEQYGGFGLSDAVLHWIGPIVQIDEYWTQTPAVGILTDDCFYVCTEQSKVTQCVALRSIIELIVADPIGCPPLLGFRIWQDPQYDLLIGISEGHAVREKIKTFLGAAYFHTTQGTEGNLRVMPMTEVVVGGSTGGLSLREPPGWKLHIEPIKNRSAANKGRAAGGRPGTSVDAAVEGELRRVAEGLRVQMLTEHARGSGPVGAGTAAQVREQEAMLERELSDTREQLRQCKAALQNAARSQTEELETIREQFLEYDREIVFYLNRVYTAYPHARQSLGSPPRLPGRLPAAPVVHPPDQQGLVEENARLRERLAELQNLRSPSRSPDGSVPYGQSSPSYGGSPSPYGGAAEARRFRTSGAVGGGLGPGGSSRPR